ncbi:MAG: hypothetical protein LKJ88_00640 [Bacilli bacterium]|jgi:hypothetical protein|nr:hypothetical protein [Bacilli bacterium]
MELDGLAEIQKYVGMEVKEVNAEPMALSLKFETKFLFIKKIKGVKIDALESLNGGIALNAISGAVLNGVSFDGIRIKLVFIKGTSPVYTLSFKADKAEKI